MRITGSLAKTLQDCQHSIPLNKKFLRDVMLAIEAYDYKNRRVPSPYYKPSSMRCKRNMYFTRISAPLDESKSVYNSVGMADTGTRRHVAIQTILENMPKLGFDWEYVDVEKYLDEKHIQGRCVDTYAKDKRGMETHLINNALHLSFMCDGIVKQVSTGEYYLFEFKNQASFKFEGKSKVDAEHLTQVTTYCLSLDLDKAFVLYENRNTCELECPEIVNVTPEKKREVIDLLMEVEQDVTKGIVPKRPDNTKECRWCNYKTICAKEV